MTGWCWDASARTQKALGRVPGRVRRRATVMFAGMIAVPSLLVWALASGIRSFLSSDSFRRLLVFTGLGGVDTAAALAIGLTSPARRGSKGLIPIVGVVGSEAIECSDGWVFTMSNRPGEYESEYIDAIRRALTLDDGEVRLVGDHLIIESDNPGIPYSMTSLVLTDDGVITTADKSPGSEPLLPMNAGDESRFRASDQSRDADVNPLHWMSRLKASMNA